MIGTVWRLIMSFYLLATVYFRASLPWECWSHPHSLIGHHPNIASGVNVPLGRSRGLSYSLLV